VSNLREADKRELLAAGANLELLPVHIMIGSAFCFCAIDSLSIPHAIWGLMSARKGVGNAFAFGTKHWGKALPAIVRNVKRFALPLVLQNDYHRIECVALAHRKDVERFLKLLGGSREALMRQWGVGGEDFVLYRWLADEHRAQTHATHDKYVAH
jgi:hypothetical protein